jgi:integrase
LAIPVAKASKAEAGITARITPHSMRYAFSDLLRAAQVDPITRRALGSWLSFGVMIGVMRQ